MRRRAITRGAPIAAVAALVFAVVASAAIPLGAGAAKKKTKNKKTATSAVFCGSPVVDNYWVTVEKLKPIPAVPEGGVLKFAPAGLTLGITGPQGILIGGTSIGLRLTNAAATTPRLDWVVLERLIRFSADGTKIQPAGLKRIDLKQLPAGKHRGLTFPLTGAPGIYSLEITIQNHRGRLLGRYGEYLRVVNRTVEVGIKLAAYDSVVPGGYLESCFENHGSASMTPTATSLERFANGTWRPVAVGPQYSPAQTAIHRTLGPGEAERIGTLIPPNALPGLYKLTATGTVLDSGEPVVIAAEFGVL